MEAMAHLEMIYTILTVIFHSYIQLCCFAGW